MDGGGGGVGGGVGIGPHAAGRPHPIGPSAWERGRNRLDRLGGVTASAPPRVEEEEEEENPGGVPGGSPWGGHAAVPVGGAARPHACPRGGGGEREGRRAVRPPPPPSAATRGADIEGGRGASPTSTRFPPRTEAAPFPRCRSAPPHTAAPRPQLRPSRPLRIHSRSSPPPPPLSDPSVPRVPRSHVAPRPATSGDVSRGGHARPWGPTDRSDATSRSDPAPRSHTAPPPLPHSAFGHERPRAPTDADGHADPRTEPRLPAPLSRSAPRRLQTRGGDTRGPGGGCGGGSRSEPRGATDAQVGPTRTGAARRRCTAAPLPLAPPRAPRSLACPALPALPVPVSVPVSPYR